MDWDTIGKLDQSTKPSEGDMVFAEESAVSYVALELAELMERTGVTKKQLAERSGLGLQRITKILEAEGILTVKALARMACALGQQVRFRYVPTPPRVVVNSECIELIRTCGDEDD